MLMADQVKQVLYSLNTSPAANATTDVQWADASDWTEIQVNGVLTAADRDLPQPTDDRIVTMVSLQVTGTQSDYTTGEVLRHLPTDTGPLMLLADMGAIVTSHNAASPVAPLVVPQYLIPGETTVRFGEIVSGADADFAWSVHMVSAERGVMSAYQGV
jgi:hypothetical protein